MNNVEAKAWKAFVIVVIKLLGNMKHDGRLLLGSLEKDCIAVCHQKSLAKENTYLSEYTPESLLYK